MRAGTGIVATLLLAGVGTVAAAEETPVVYTNADLVRLFGPPSAAPGAPAPRPEAEAEWSLVDSVLQREQERLEAERQMELERVRAAAPPPEPAFVYPVVWRLGFPASVWWRHVWCSYSGSEGTPGEPGLYPPCPSQPEPEPVYRPNATDAAR